MPEALPIAVVGSGPSGLAAAFRLQQAGHDVQVLEASDHVGGRTMTSRRDGFTFDEGAVVLAKNYTQTLSIVREAGLEKELLPSGSLFAFARDGDLHYFDADHPVRDGLRIGLLSTRSKLAAVKLGIDLMRIKPSLGYDDLSRAAKFDTESAAQYSARRLNPEIHEYLVDLTIRAATGADPTDVSKVDFFFSLMSWIGSKFFVFRDGMGSYAELLGQQLKVRLQTAVTAVVDGPDGVEVTARGADGVERTESFAGCVVAIEGPNAAEVVPGLDEWRRTYLRNLRYSKQVAINIAQSKPIPDQRAFAIVVPRSVHPGLLGCFFPHNLAPGRVPAGKGMVQVLTSDAWAQDLIDEDDDSVIEQLMRTSAEVFPGSTNDVEWVTVTRWQRMGVAHPPGFTADLNEFHRRCKASDRRVQLAGDYWSVSSVNTATASGERAARDLQEALRSSSRLAR